ncbi:hypothetical protein E3N88_15209 [Mikania micrantha]|uniref:Thioredoxin domain-containing protein n=1 Tax=Mikania micrantha TaxID=192012 RepID=A0A5N6NUZ4_9ASTR|nr:hypothetical protein E3N88_15209 [Mikania micrantha]
MMPKYSSGGGLNLSFVLSNTVKWHVGTALIITAGVLIRTLGANINWNRTEQASQNPKSFKIGGYLLGIELILVRIRLAALLQGDETSLQKALSIVDTNTHDYVVLLFYASWCPFSTMLKPHLSTMSSLFPSIPHFAIEESVVKSSVLSKYGVNGFPTLFVLNSTMRARYHGSRTLSSLVSFYTDVTGVDAEHVDITILNTMNLLAHDKGDNNSKDPEICPFTWAKSPENLLRQETYLALASLFVIFRSIYLIYPFIITSVQYARRTRLLWEHSYAYLNRAIQLFSSLTGCMGLGFFNERKH